MGLTKPRASQIYDIDYKQATRVLTVTNIALAGGAPNQVDGVNLSIDDRVLVIGQDTASQNGIYLVDSVGSGADGTWIRSTDTNSTGELLAGTIVMVTEGLTYHDTQWKLITDNPIVIGTTPLTFEQNSAFGFGNIYANNTAVLATSVGDALTISAGDYIGIVANNTSKSITIGVTGLSLSSISNGNSNVEVIDSNGNVSIGVNGISNVSVFSTDGLDVTGNIGVGNIISTGNVYGGNLYTTGQVAVSGNLTSTNVYAEAEISAVGNITGSYLFGNGSQLSGIGSSANLAVLTRSSGIVYFPITAGFLTVVGRAGNISIPLAA